MEPLFGSRLSLLARLRMSGMCEAQGDTADIFDDCVLQARLSMQEAFGTAQLAVYGATPAPSGNAPATDSDFLYYRLRRLEDKLVEKHLLWRLVQVNMEGSSDINEYLDSDYPYKDMDVETLKAKYERLCREVSAAFDGLNTVEDFSPGGSLTTVNLGPCCTAPSVQGLGADLSPAVCGGEARSSWFRR